ncbi:MAG: hypothetical protein J5772_04230 [Clostridia bacterium]|nr:hypothetical protein [Clostridia bacterium]
MENNEKKLNIARTVLVAAFALVLGLLFLLLLVLPKKTGELSQLEFRVLAEDPIRGKDASQIAEELANGKLSSNVDTFLEDHFPFRSFFIALDSYSGRLSGRNAEQSVLRGGNGRLFDAALRPVESQLDENIADINAFAEANGLDAAIVMVPSSAAVYPEDLPLLHYEYRDADYIARIREMSSAYVPDLIALYGAASDKEGLYYRTDHHWTMDGAYLCYRDICERFGVTPMEKSAFTVTGYEFYGSFYREAGLWLTEPDTLEVWRSSVLEVAKVTIGRGDRAKKYEGVYDSTKLKDDEIDKYAAYLYSNNGLTVIENPLGNGETLLIVKDSYGNSIAPLFAMNYSRIVMIDTRYYTDPTLPKPSELLAEYGITRMVVVLGAESMVSDCMLVYLR